MFNNPWCLAHNMRYPAGVVLPPGVYERVQKNHRIKPTFHFILSSRNLIKNMVEGLHALITNMMQMWQDLETRPNFTQHGWLQEEYDVIVRCCSSLGADVLLVAISK